MPRLSLRGTAIPIIAKEVAVSGFDNGKVMAVSLTTRRHRVGYGARLAARRTELDRLVDIDSAVRVVGDNVFAAGFQGRTAMLALDSGQIWWAHDMSSYRGLAVDEENLFVTQSDGVVVALRQRDGSELWRNDKLKRRGLSTPAVTSTAIAVADYQGYLHWLDKSTGELVARQRVAKFRVSNPPVAVKDTVVVLTDAGNLAAFRAIAPRRPQVSAAAHARSRAARSRIDRPAERGQVDLVQCHDRHARCAGRRSAGPDARSAVRVRAPHRGALHRGRHRRPGRERRAPSRV